MTEPTRAPLRQRHIITSLVGESSSIVKRDLHLESEPEVQSVLSASFHVGDIPFVPSISGSLQILCLLRFGICIPDLGFGGIAPSVVEICSRIEDDLKVSSD